VQLAMLRARFVHVPEPLYCYHMHGASYSFGARQDDALSKARLVIDNAAFFPSWTVTWARDLLHGEAGVDPMGRGIIPVLPEHVARQRAG